MIAEWALRHQKFSTVTITSATLAAMYLQRGPMIAKCSSTTHRTHRHGNRHGHRHGKVMHSRSLKACGQIRQIKIETSSVKTLLDSKRNGSKKTVSNSITILTNSKSVAAQRLLCFLFSHSLFYDCYSDVRHANVWQWQKGYQLMACASSWTLLLETDTILFRYVGSWESKTYVRYRHRRQTHSCPSRWAAGEAKNLCIYTR